MFFASSASATTDPEAVLSGIIGKLQRTATEIVEADVANPSTRAEKRTWKTKK
jgi:hypothetical protein